MSSESQTYFGSTEFLVDEVSPKVEEYTLQLIVDCFRRWKRGGFIRTGNCERHFNIRMYECMKYLRRKREMPVRISYEYVTPTDSMLEGSDDPAHARRIDIAVFSLSTSSDESFLTIECKRLDLGSRLPGYYVSKGIRRFVQGHYGVKTRIGTMIGYVIEGTPEEVVRIVNARVESILDSGHKLIPIDSIGWLETVYSSKHDRTSSPSPISITHLLFNMNDIESYPFSTQLASTGTDKDVDEATVASSGG